MKQITLNIPDNELSFLKIVKILAIEIHDEFNIREVINEILISNNFIIFDITLLF